MKYDPDTGIPRYVPDIGEELEEGVTPAPTVVTSKSDLFKGDKPLTKEMYERLRDGPTVANSESYTVGVPTDEADKMLSDAIKSAKPAKLDKDVATDEEVDVLEKFAREHTVRHWPELLRLINRLRQAEAK
jgi:hypothetical protein